MPVGKDDGSVGGSTFRAGLEVPGIFIGSTLLGDILRFGDFSGDVGKYGFTSSVALEGETPGMATGAVLGAGTDPSIRDIAPSALPANGDATRPPRACFHLPVAEGCVVGGLVVFRLLLGVAR